MISSCRMIIRAIVWMESDCVVGADGKKGAKGRLWPRRFWGSCRGRLLAGSALLGVPLAAPTCGRQYRKISASGFSAAPVIGSEGLDLGIRSGVGTVGFSLLLAVSSKQHRTLIDMSAWAPDLARAPGAVTIGDELGLKGLAPSNDDRAKASMDVRMCTSDMLLDVLGIHDVHLADDTVLGELMAEGRVCQQGRMIRPGDAPNPREARRARARAGEARARSPHACAKRARGARAPEARAKPREADAHARSARGKPHEAARSARSARRSARSARARETARRRAKRARSAHQVARSAREAARSAQSVREAARSRAKPREAREKRAKPRAGSRTKPREVREEVPAARARARAKPCEAARSAREAARSQAKRAKRALLRAR